MSTPEITNISFHGAPDDLREKGLLGFLSFAVNGVVAIQGVTLRRTPEGGLALQYPFRPTPCGHQIDYGAPVDDSVRRAIELQVLAMLSTQVPS